MHDLNFYNIVQIFLISKKEMRMLIMKFLNYLHSNKVLVADGAMGTMLLKYELKSGDCPEEINIKNPEIIEKIHIDYINAGAELIQTNTFGANRIKLEPFNLQNKVEKIVKEGVKIAKESAGDNGWVGLSVGPTGKFLRPLGELSFNELIEIFTEQISAGVEAGCDCICIETMGDVGEVKAAFLAASSFNVPISCSVSFQNQGLTLMGTDPETFSKIIENWNCDIAASNCASPEELLYVAECISQYSTKPCYIRPNAGKPEIKNGKTVYPMNPEQFSLWSKKLIDTGVSIIGGCCGTLPEHIEAVKNNLQNINPLINKGSSKKWISSFMENVEIKNELKGCWIKLNNYIKNNKVDEDAVIDALKTLPEKEHEVIYLDITDIDQKTAAGVIESIQLANRKPLIFRANNPETLEEFIKPYKGIAGIIAQGIEKEKCLYLLNKYGGELLE